MIMKKIYMTPTCLVQTVEGEPMMFESRWTVTNGDGGGRVQDYDGDLNEDGTGIGDDITFNAKGSSFYDDWNSDFSAYETW